MPLHIQVVDLLILLLHRLGDGLPLRLLSAPLPLHVDILVLGAEAVQLSLEIQVALLLGIVLHEPVLSLFLLVQNRVAPLLRLPRGLVRDDPPPHHSLEGFLGVLLLLLGHGLHEPFLSGGFLLLLLLKVLPALPLDGLILQDALADLHVSGLLSFPHQLLEGLLLLVHQIDPPLVLRFHLVLPRLELPRLLLALPLLLPLQLAFPLRLLHLPIMELLRSLCLQLPLVLHLQLLLVKLFLGQLLLQLGAGLHLQLLPLLLGGPAVVHLLHLAALLPHQRLLVLGGGVQELVGRLQGLELLQLAVQGLAQPLPLDLLGLEQLLALQLQGVAVERQDGPFAEAALLGNHLQLRVGALLLPVRQQHLPRLARRREQVPALRLEEVIPQLHQAG
mmetsp:Transcript_17382/g.41176  ORF Transcript_17382/g.41176 Transcript_17382/m.41176 type:complete len:390 (-) Transcript_17382:175-1344(-)